MRNPSSSSSSSGTKTPCCSKVGIKKGPWTPEEDEVLSNYIKREGEGRWRTMPKRAGLLRCGKSCRLRWMNYLRPSVKRGRIAPDEEDLILRLHRLLGNRWSLIAGRIPGRTDNDIKNYWNAHLSKKLISQGIDPRTHKPLNLILTSSEINERDDHHDHHHHLPPSSNPNPNPPSLVTEETVGSHQATNFTTNPYQNHEAFINDDLSMDGFMTWLLPSSHIHGHNNRHEDYIGNYNEDTFSSFLDSLIISDNVFVNQQHQLPPPPPPNMVASSAHRALVSSAQTSCNHGTSNWDAEIVSTMAPVVNHQEQQRAAETAYNLSTYKTKYYTY